MKVNTDGILLGAWANSENPKFILDIGTGTGVIALMMAQRFSESNVYGVELDKASAIEAGYNFRESQFNERMFINNGAIQDFAQQSPLKFDCIVSNPPYFTSGPKSGNLIKSQARHALSLTFEDLVSSVNQLLTSDGEFSLILPSEEAVGLIEIAHFSQLYLCRKCIVYSKMDKSPERLLMTFNRIPSRVAVEELCIYTKKSNYTPAYINLTQDFYLNM